MSGQNKTHHPGEAEISSKIFLPVLSLIVFAAATQSAFADLSTCPTSCVPFDPNNPGNVSVNTTRGGASLPSGALTLCPTSLNPTSGNCAVAQTIPVSCTDSVTHQYLVYTCTTSPTTLQPPTSSIPPLVAAPPSATNSGGTSNSGTTSQQPPNNSGASITMNNINDTNPNSPIAQITNSNAPPPAPIGTLPGLGGNQPPLNPSILSAPPSNVVQAPPPSIGVINDPNSPIANLNAPVPPPIGDLPGLGGNQNPTLPGNNAPTVTEALPPFIPTGKTTVATTGVCAANQPSNAPGGLCTTTVETNTYTANPAANPGNGATATTANTQSQCTNPGPNGCPPEDPCNKLTGIAASNCFAGENANAGNSAPDAVKYTANDDCNVSKDIASFGGGSAINPACGGVRAMITTTAVTTAVAQQVGSQAVSTIGQMSQQKAMMQGASMSTLYQSAAQMSEKASEANIAMGAGQAMMGVLETMQGNKHKGMAADFSAQYAATGSQVKGTQNGTSGSVDMRGQVLDMSANAMGIGGGPSATNGTYKVATVSISNGVAQETSLSKASKNAAPAAPLSAGEQNALDGKTAQNLAATATSLSSAAVSEQNGVAEAASTAGVTDMAKGGAAIVSGGFQLAIAKQQAALYAMMANQVTAAAPGADPFAAQTNTITPNTISGAGTTSAAQSAATAVASPNPAGSGGPLGAPLGDIPNLGVAGTPPSPDPAATDGTGTNTPGGPAIAGGAIGTTPAPPGASEEPSAKYADAGRSGVPYTGVGGYSSSGGGGNGRGNSNDPSVDPKTLMAMMNGMMNPDKQAREPAAVDVESYGHGIETPYAPLPSGENVFQYISKSYQGLQQKGRI